MRISDSVLSMLPVRRAHVHSCITWSWKKQKEHVGLPCSLEKLVFRRV